MTNKTKWVWAICIKGGSIGGCFEGYSLSEVVKQMVKDCVGTNEYPGEIVKVFATTDSYKEISLRSKVVGKINSMVSKCVDEELAERYKEARNYEGIEKELRSDYCASVL